MSEIADGFDVSTSSAKSVENFSDTSTLLHRNDSELILLVNPHQECLGFVVENTSAIWPVSVKVACSQESVSLFEEEMIGNELILIGFAHTLKWVEGSFKITFESIACCNNLIHDFISLLFGDTWTKWVALHVSTDSDSCGVNHGAIFL